MEVSRFHFTVVGTLVAVFWRVPWDGKESEGAQMKRYFLPALVALVPAAVILCASVARLASFICGDHFWSEI